MELESNRLQRYIQGKTMPKVAQKRQMFQIVGNKKMSQNLWQLLWGYGQSQEVSKVEKQRKMFKKMGGEKVSQNLRIMQQ